MGGAQLEKGEVTSVCQSELIEMTIGGLFSLRQSNLIKSHPHSPDGSDKLSF